MDYFTDVLAMFGRIRELSDFIKNILICVPEMNEGLMGLEWHEGVMTEFSFLGELTLF